MPRFLVESPHSDKECLMALENFLATGYLTHFDWGCDVGDHRGWMIIEAESEEEALMVVPSVLRRNARAIQLIKFTPEDLEKERTIHNKKG